MSSSGRGRPRGPRPTIKTDLSTDLSLSIQSPKSNHKDKYALTLLSQPGPSSPRPTSAGPIQISNSFSPLRSESPSFKTIASSHISPHSSKQIKLAQSNQSQITSPSFPRVNSPTYQYQIKPFFDRYFAIETPLLLDHYFKEPKKLADAIIDPMFCRIPEDITKRHIFYEFILVDTDSIYISDVFDKIDKEKLIFRKIKLCKIITLDQWGVDPNKKNKFSRPFHVSEYSYWDYIDAWTNVLYGQNPGNSLSWFVYFDKDFPLQIPFWFLEWWDKYGPTIDLLPHPVKEGYAQWMTYLDKPIDWDFIPDLLLFFKHFNLTWILMLDYAIRDKMVGNVNVPYFGRQTKVKWWSGMNISDHGKNRVNKWFSDNPTLCKSTDQSQFLMAKSQNQARIAAASTPEELRKIAQEMEKTMNSMSQKDSESDYQDDDDDLLDEEEPTDAHSYFGHDASPQQLSPQQRL